jgi:hypothetical protein
MGEKDAEQNVDVAEAREALKESYAEPDDGQHYNDRSKLDFDPADGLYSGTAVEGTSEIAGPHENQDAVGVDDDSSPEQRATERAEASIATEDRTAETEHMSRREPADLAAGQEIDYAASRDASTDAGGERSD